MKNKFIKIKRNFSRSSNIKIDFSDQTSIKNIILSDKLQRAFVDVTTPMSDDSSNQRVHVFAGTPGTGKSTFALFTAHSLTANSKTKIAAVVKQQRRLASSYFWQNWSAVRRVSYLPVFLNGDEGEIEDAFYTALNDAFAVQGWQKDFERLSAHSSIQAVEIINGWQKNYPSKYEELQGFIASQPNSSYQKFIRALRQNRRHAQKTFVEAYRQITGGASIGSYRHGQVVTLYRNAAQFLQDTKGLDGIFIIYDEFGKYLERGVRQPHNFDLHFLQDMAELCNRSEALHIHMLLIAHLPVSQYTTQLPRIIQQEWKKVEGRFQQSSFNSGYESSYTLVAAVFDSDIKQHHNKLWKKLHHLTSKWRAYNKASTNLAAACACTVEKISNCYPLHPSVFALLPLLSERVAQHERTMFSFLTRNEEFSLPRFIEKTVCSENRLHFMRPYDLYCYFRPLIAGDVGIGGASKIAIIVDGALNSLDSEQTCAQDIVALLGIAAVINNRSLLTLNAPSLTALLWGLHDSQDIDDALKFLQKNKFIAFDKIKTEFNLFDGSSVDLQEELNKVRQKSLTTDGYNKILKDNCHVNFVVPKEYNFNNGITRFFREQLLSLEELAAGKYHVDYSKEDGRVFYIIPFNNAEVQRIKDYCQRASLASALFVTSDKPIEITSELLELQAIAQLYSRKELLSAGGVVRKELDHYRDNARALVSKALQRIRSNLYMCASIFYRGKCLGAGVKTIARLAQLASQVCANEYCNYPRFNNEMINRHRPSNPIIQGRTRFIEACRNNFAVKRFGIEGGGPEFAMYQALMCANLFVRKGKNRVPTFNEGSALLPLFKDFCSYLQKSEQSPVGMDELIAHWQRPPFGVRLALVPIYLNLFTNMMPSPISFFYEGLYVGKVDTDMFETSIKQPKKYSLRMVTIDAKKRSYLHELVNKFAECLPDAAPVHKSTLDFIGVAKIITRFYTLIPNYTRRHPALTTREKQLITALEGFRQPESFILFGLPELYTKKPFVQLTLREQSSFLQTLKHDIESLFKHYVDLIKRLAQQQKLALQKLQNSSGTVVFSKVARGAPLAVYWLRVMNNFPAEVLLFPFSAVTTRFVNRVTQMGSNASNQMVVENIADALTGANPKNWSEKGEALFNFNLQRTITEIEEVHYLKAHNNTNMVRISSLQTTNNNPVVREIICTKLDHGKHKQLLERLCQHLSHLSNEEKNSILLTMLEHLNTKQPLSSSKITGEASIGAAWG
ncbi:MAG: hypothetical protein OYH77_06825 [Pseudomonadota bacterium]|nr:hypothetical protein [Pseudomonadota bacterium]